MKKLNLIISTILLVWLFGSSCSKDESTPVPTPVTTPIPTSSDVVQDLLDNGLTPIQVFNQGYTLSEIYCKTYGGGYIFYLDTISGEGLVCSTIDFGNNIEWDEAYAFVNGTSYFHYIGNTDTTLWSGEQNTINVASSSPNSACALVANYTGSGYSDWFISSKNESRLMLEVLGTELGYNILSHGMYWSSSEIDENQAWEFLNTDNLGSSGVYSYYKGTGRNIRPVRKF